MSRSYTTSTTIRQIRISFFVARRITPRNILETEMLRHGKLRSAVTADIAESIRTIPKPNLAAFTLAIFFKPRMSGARFRQSKAGGARGRRGGRPGGAGRAGGAGGI